MFSIQPPPGGSLPRALILCHQSFSPRFSPSSGWAQRGGVPHGLAHGGGRGGTWGRPWGLSLANTPPAPFITSPRGGRSSRSWGGARRTCVWALGSRSPWEGRVCRKPWGLEDRDALRLAFCAALRSAPVLWGFASSALQLPAVSDREAQLLPDSGDRGEKPAFHRLRTAPGVASVAIKASTSITVTAQGGPTASDSALVLCVCVCGSVCTRTRVGAGA